MMNSKYNSGTIPRDVYQALQNAIETRDLEYADNFRFAPEDDPEGLNQFETISDNGCCGSFLMKFTDSEGRVWLIGCNYGH